MDEFKFVLKCFIFSALVILFSRVQLGEESLENRAQSFLQDSPTGQFLQQSAAGGVRLLGNVLSETKDFVQKKMSQFNSGFNSSGQSDTSYRKKRYQNKVDSTNDHYEEDRY